MHTLMILKVLILLSLSTLTLASEKTEKCILDTPDGLKKSLLEKFSELAEKGYKPCSEKVSWMGGDHEGIDSRYSLPSKINDKEFRTCAEASDPAEKVLYVLNKLGVFEAKKLDKNGEKVYNGDAVYSDARDKMRFGELKKNKWLKIDESKLINDKGFEYRTQKAIEFRKSKSKKYSRYYELKKDDPKAKIALYNLVLSSADGISGIKTPKDYKERPITKEEALSTVEERFKKKPKLQKDKEVLINLIVMKCKYTEYEDLRVKRCYQNEDDKTSVYHFSLVSKQNKDLISYGSSQPDNNIILTFEFKGIRYYLYESGYDTYSFSLMFSVDGKVYFIDLPKKCDYFDTIPFS